MTKILPFLNDPGIQRRWVDHEDGTVTVTEQQTLDGLFDNNQAMANHNDGYTPSREMRRVASVDTTTLYRWLIEEGFDARQKGSFKEALDRICKKKLNDPDFRKFRTAPGRL